jgi:hypothetical protein
MQCSKELPSFDRVVGGARLKGRLGLARQCRNRYDFDYEVGMCKCRNAD